LRPQGSAAGLAKTTGNPEPLRVARHLVPLEAMARSEGADMQPNGITGDLSMHQVLTILFVLALVVCFGAQARAVKPTADEMGAATAWGQAHLGADATALPFSFTYNGQASTDLIPAWKSERTTRRLDRNRTQHTLACSDPATGLVVRCEAIEYHDFPTVEWTVYLRNSGQADTPIIQDIQALDITLQRRDESEFLLHHAVGSPANGSDYAPLETSLGPEASKRISAAGGRPTNSDWSYFNLEWGEEGLIVAVGWPGQWAAEFARDSGTGIRVRAGQELTHFKLLAGEEVRTPLIVLQFWKGDWVRAQNIWRRWMMAHSMPRPGGALPKPIMLGCSSRAYEEMIHANTENQIMFIDRYLEEGLKIDYWWMDAGWYVQQSGWPQVGTWEVDPKRFPQGLRPISDHAHSKGIKILVWFEPERVAAGTWLTENHPEWILGGAGGGLLNLGNADAWNWLVNHIDGLLTAQGIDLYRQDFNMDPLEFWRRNDAEDRQGITEIKHVTGYLASWDELRRRHPQMLIDSCASGGRRNDLETMRRAVPLWRSDYAFEPIGHQGMTYGLSLWLPFHGTGTVATATAPYYGSGPTPVEPYAFWSNACPSINCGFDVRVKELDYAALRRLFGQWRRMADCYYGDFYPLTPYSRARDAWAAWQFDRPEQGHGVVQAFRRDQSPYEAARFRLRGLEPNARYSVGEIGASARRQVSGSELMEKGLSVEIRDQPGVAIIAYHRVASPARKPKGK
jgi:alpha-galactosidase